MQIQSKHTDEDRGLDAYFTPIEAIGSLIKLEGKYIPQHIWEPAAGNGAIVTPLRAAGFDVFATDIENYNTPFATTDYLKATKPCIIQGIITNPPFKLVKEFTEKALSEVNYLALLLRTNFLESIDRLPLFRQNPPAMVWISSRRLPMMHRFNWTGPKAPSNTCYAWFIWDKKRPEKQKFDWFDYEELGPFNSGRELKL